MSCPPVRIARSAEAKLCSHSTSKPAPPWDCSIVRVRTKSSSSSSTSRTRSASVAAIAAVLWEFDEVEPVDGERLHRRGELLEADGLADERVHAEVVCADDVLLGLGGRQHDDRDAPQLGVALDL